MAALVKTITTLAGTEASFATRHMKTLVGKFEKMRDEKLQSQSKLPRLFNQEPGRTHRIFIRTYYINSKSDQTMR